MRQTDHQKVNVPITCSCGKTETREVQIPPQTVPGSSWPYAQKIFPIRGVFGLATFGAAGVNNRSIFNHMDELNEQFPNDDKKENFFEKISKFIVDYFEGQLKAEWGKNGVDEKMMPDTHSTFGFLLCGHQRVASREVIPISRRIFIAKKSVIQDFTGFGCMLAGVEDVVQLLWQKNTNIANYPAFSLQDAVDYAKFLIRTTADFQRFLGKFPTVGGDIDVALITNQAGFRWLEQKKLYRMLEREEKTI